MGKELTCQNGTWGPDLLGAFLYRAPAGFAYQWTLNGAPYTTNRTFMANRARRLHLHRDGHQPSRVDLADEFCEEEVKAK